MATEAAPQPPAPPKRVVPVYVPEGYVVRRRRGPSEGGNGSTPDGVALDGVALDGAGRRAGSRRRFGPTGLLLVLLLGVTLGYAAGFAVARHTADASVTVTVSQPKP